MNIKGQIRMAKDSIMVLDKGRYLFSDNAILKRLMGIPCHFRIIYIIKKYLPKISAKPPA